MNSTFPREPYNKNTVIGTVSIYGLGLRRSAGLTFLNYDAHKHIGWINPFTNCNKCDDFVPRVQPLSCLGKTKHIAPNKFSKHVPGLRDVKRATNAKNVKRQILLLFLFFLIQTFLDQALVNQLDLLPK